MLFSLLVWFGLLGMLIAPKPAITIEDRITVCPGGHAPKVVRLASGRLVMAVRAGLTGVGSNSSVALVESADGGRSWSPPRQIYDSPDDDRVQTLNLLPDGTLLLGFVAEAGGRAQAYWLRSSDQGRSWGRAEPIDPAPFDYIFPFGEVVVRRSGGLILSAYGGYYPMYESAGKPPERQGYSSWLLESTDGGQSWRYHGRIARFANQTHIARLGTGDLVAVLRSAELATLTTYEKSLQHPTDYCLVTFSRDEGRTWSQPKRITDPAEMQGFPLVASTGEILLSTSVRRPPFGVAIRISRDEGKSWSPPAPLAEDAPSADVGLTQTIEVGKRRFLTFYHFENRRSPDRAAGVLGVFWRLD